jgi:hypothetical protein
MSNLIEELDLAFCEVCDSYVTAVRIGRDYLCKSEVDVFGADLATVVG